MRRFFISAILILSANYAVAASSSSFTVEGTITGSTCKMSNPNVAVELPASSRGRLTKTGDTAGRTPFSITAEKCPAGATIYFQYDQKNVTPQGRLLNTVEAASADKAENIELELLNSSFMPINLSAAKGLQSASPSMAEGTDGNATFNFYVQYYATGSATAGKVKSSLTFLVESF